MTNVLHWIGVTLGLLVVVWGTRLLCAQPVVRAKRSVNAPTRAVVGGDAIAGSEMAAVAAARIGTATAR